MSFFKDFKEDLSQAVNELLPEDAAKESTAPESMGELTAAFAENGTVASDDDIAKLLEQVDNMSISDLAKDIDAQSPLAQESVEQSMDSAIAEGTLFESKTVGYATADSISEMVNAIPAEPEPAVQTANVVYAEPVIPAEPAAPAEPQAAPVSIEEITPEPIPVPTPVVSPEPVVQAAAPVQLAPAQAAAPQAQAPAPERKPVEPVFKESSYHAAPINTTSTKTTKETGVIIEGMSVTGDIISDGNLEILGSVKGNIKLDGKLKITGSLEGNSDIAEVFADGAKISGDLRATGSVKVGQGSVIRGNINATGAVVAGAVKGDIDIVGPVILDSTAIIMGNIKSKTLQINNGAVIEGLCSQCYAEVNPMSFFEGE
ncbi:MAG: polymer-forming cytoskeletal protein [Lachnospiraceae bacterium]|nr:polymer-forming cytoskeletal protein [Lachnospiraceae bacterium]